MRWAWHEFFKSYDLLLCPLIPTPAIRHEHTKPTYERTLTINGKPYPFSASLFWAGMVGLPYLPATAAPSGFSRDGLPLGIQIVGPHYHDRTTIHFAKLMEAEYQGYVPPPGYE